MIRRLFWLGAGVAIGVVVVRKLSAAAESYTPAGIAAAAQKSAVGLADSVREFMIDVRDGMAEREQEIYAALAENAEFGGVNVEFDAADEDLRYLHGQPHPYSLESETER